MNNVKLKQSDPSLVEFKQSLFLFALHSGTLFMLSYFCHKVILQKETAA